MNSVKLSANIVLFIVAALVVISPSIAKPMTFRFEGEVGDVFSHPMFDADIDIETGNQITGHFTFDPDSGDGGNFLSLVQKFSSSITIDGNTWATSEIRLQAFNDHYDPGPEGELRVITDVVPDGVTPIRGPFDILQVGSDRSSPVTAIDNLAGTDTQLHFWTLHLLNTSLANSGVGEMALPLEQAQIPIDIAAWNSFAERSLTVSLLDSSGRGVTISTTVGDLQVVPEPSACCLALVLGATFSYMRWQR